MSPNIEPIEFPPNPFGSEPHHEGGEAVFALDRWYGLVIIAAATLML